MRSILVAMAMILALAACGGGSSSSGGSSSAAMEPAPEPAPEPVPESQQLREQFGTGRDYFTDQGMQELLDFEDGSSPIVLLQLMAVTDAEGFAAYEEEAAALWESVGAGTLFASSVFARMIGEREMVEVRAIEFPSIDSLLELMKSEPFTEVMELLFAASDDHAWVLGVEDFLPFDPSGSYIDPALQNLDQGQAVALLQSLAGGESGFDGNPQVVIDMLVSDSPDPFWMVNLIDFYEQANYADGRDSDLTGIEANAIYGETILPTLSAFNSFPEVVMPVAVVLTADTVQWEQAAIVRYASRDAFLNAFVLNPLAGEALAHKEAGVENTLVLATEVDGEELPEAQDGVLYNFRYCEVLLFNADGDEVRADVYNSMGYGNCPQEAWEALDAESIAAEFGADRVGLNGIRFWVLDLIENTAEGETPTETAQFGELTMRLAASVLLPPGADAGQEGGISYQVNRVSRSTIFHYNAGRQVYELQDPDGVRYMMQSFTRQVDQDLQLEDLPQLGDRLALPPGWTFSTRILEEEFQLQTVNGIAEVVTDDLSNTYQRIP